MKMKHYSSIFSLILLVSAQVFKADNDGYIDLDKNRSNLAQVVTDICGWDDDKNSLLWQLNRYISNGNPVALQKAVLEVLAYAESVVVKKRKKLSSEQLRRINNDLDVLAQAINNGDLSADIEDGEVIRSKTFDSRVRFTKDVFFDNKIKVKCTAGIFDLALLLNEVQKHQAHIKALNERVAALEERA